MVHNIIEHTYFMTYFVLMEIITNPLLFHKNNTQYEAQVHHTKYLLPDTVYYGG